MSRDTFVFSGIIPSAVNGPRGSRVCGPLMAQSSCPAPGTFDWAPLVLNLQITTPENLLGSGGKATMILMAAIYECARHHAKSFAYLLSFKSHEASARMAR